MARIGLASSLLVLIACGGGKPLQPDGGAIIDGYALNATAGEYEDGSGASGLVVLATLRDSSGKGPSTPWTVSLSDGTGDLGVTAQYDSSGDGSYALWLFPQVRLSVGTHYTLKLTNQGNSAQAVVTPDFRPVVGVPLANLSSNGAAITWPAPTGAVAYRCIVTSGGDVQLQADSTQPSCDISALPPNTSLSASVLSMDVNLATIAADHSQSPSLPQIDVSEGRLAFVKGDGSTPTVSLAAAGGGLYYSTGTDALMVWLSITNSDGSPTTTPWNVSISGPGIPSSSPLQVTYPASLGQDMFWNYDIQASEGLYSVVASSGGTQLSTTFQVPRQIDLYQPVPITGNNSSAETISWGAIQDAKSYYASVYDQTSGAFISGQWTSGLNASFSSQLFTPYQACNAYVLATDFDMTQPGRPTEIRGAENTMAPASFIAP